MHAFSIQGVAILFCFAAASCLADQQPPNILLMVAEDLSPRTGSYGDSVARTPNIDALAAKGTRYTNVFTTAGVCAPSRAALITGLHQISFGAQHMRSSTGPHGEYFAQPPAAVRAFPEILRAHGYFTYTDTKLDYQFSGVRAGTGPFTIWDREGAPDLTWRERAAGQPFFAMINFLETHESGVMRADGEPHGPIHAATQRMRHAGGMVAPAVTSPDDVGLPPYYPDLPQVRADLARHYDNIHAMDARVGRIMAALAADGLLDNTIVIWTSDHGDGLPRAKRELFDSGLHVPFILHIPEGLRARYDKAAHTATDTRLVSFVDLAPSVLELAGVPLPEYLHGSSLLGSSRDYVFAARDRIDEVDDRQRAVRSKRFKYIRSWRPEVPGGHPLAYRDNLDMVRAWRAAHAEGGLKPIQRAWFEPAGTERLFDIAGDPHELHDLAQDAAYGETLETLRGALDAFLERVGDTSEVPEVQMRNAMLRDGAIPVTPAPEIRQAGGQISLHSAIGASIGYRYAGETHWRLYTTPLPARALTARAVRYGWRASAESRAE